jgi:hypothetical protein
LQDANDRAGEAEESTHTAYRLMQAIIDRSPAAISVKDLEGRYLFVNDRCAQLSGYSDGEIIGTTDHDRLPKDIADEISRTDDAAIADGATEIEESRIIGDGELHTFISLKFPLVDAAGVPYAVCGISTDITSRRRSADEIVRLNHELEGRVLERTIQLEATNKELEAFSYSVAHDLRAPLRAVDGFSRILSAEYADKLDGEALDYLKRIQSGAQRMGELIDGLLNLSRLQRAEMRHETVSLSAIANDTAVALAQNDPARAGVTFEIKDAPTVTGDPDQLRAVLNNLMSNAWKFTKVHDSAHIGFGFDDSTGTPAFYVKDDGAGFNMAYADKLFGAFQRLHGATEFEGLGIGLATVARIVRRHGGTIWATGEVDNGATVYFTLPTRGDS